MFKIITGALMSFAFIWFTAPHQPDLGAGRLQTIETLASVASAVSARACAQSCGGPAANLDVSRDATLDVIARLRSDLRANETQIGASSRNRTF